MLWLRLENETAACPACGSSRLALLDVFSIRRNPLTGRRVAFLSGCEDCGLAFANPLPTSDELQHYYSHDGSWTAAHGARVRVLKKRQVRQRKGDSG